MKTVMVSGNFDPFHHVHLAYIEQAAQHSQWLICIVTSDDQLLMKKGRVNIPELARARIVDLILAGLGIPHEVRINTWDKGTTLVAEAIRFWRPNIFFRGNDKTLETMPPEERRACDELGIQIIHAQLPFEYHSSQMVL